MNYEIYKKQIIKTVQKNKQEKINKYKQINKIREKNVYEIIKLNTLML